MPSNPKIGIDQHTMRWPGSGSLQISGSTPFGFYDNDPKFINDCYRSAIWACNRMGYPIIDIELIDVNLYAYFEEAVNEYGAQLNQFNIQNNFLSVVGSSTSQNFNGQAFKGTAVPYIVELANTYGSEGNLSVGGYVDQKQGNIMVTAHTQVYDLQALWGDPEEGSRIEIRRIFHNMSPAFARIYDPFSMTGMSYSNILNEMGFGGYSPATQFLMCPIFEDLLRGQAIQFNDMVRKSAFSFELINNKLKIFPVPNGDFKLYFEYVVESDKYNSNFYTGSSYQNISDFSNVPYSTVQYSSLNAPATQWIRKYFLTLVKESLGAIRQKYSTIPIPNGEVTLDGGELRSEAVADREILVTQLREMLASTTNQAQLEAQQAKNESIMGSLKSIPLGIYIGAFLISLILI